MTQTEAPHEAALQVKLAEALAAMSSDPSATTIKAYQDAKRAIDLLNAEKVDTSSAERFKNIEKAAAWVVSEGYIVSHRTVRNHNEMVAGFPKRQKDGSFLKGEIAAYAAKTWENPSQPEAREPQDDTNEQIKKENLRKLQISNDQRLGSLVPLEDELRRRVNVIVGMKIAMGNQRPFFMRELAERMRKSHHGETASTVITDLVQESGHLYNDIIMRVFDAIGKQGGLQLPNQDTE